MDTPAFSRPALSPSCTWTNAGEHSDEPDGFVERLAKRIAGFPPKGVCAAKRLINDLTPAELAHIRSGAATFQALIALAEAREPTSRTVAEDERFSVVACLPRLHHVSAHASVEVGPQARLAVSCDAERPEQQCGVTDRGEPLTAHVPDDQSGAEGGARRRVQVTADSSLASAAR